MRLQTEVLRQRLAWLARVQACSRARRLGNHRGGAQIRNPARRFGHRREDRPHRPPPRNAARCACIDYKTGKVDAVDKSHRRKITAATMLPAHLGADCPAVYSGEEKGKPADFRWINLQLPLYALAVRTPRRQWCRSPVISPWAAPRRTSPSANGRTFPRPIWKPQNPAPAGSRTRLPRRSSGRPPRRWPTTTSPFSPPERALPRCLPASPG